MLHAGDYLVAAWIVGAFAMWLLPAIPTAQQSRMVVAIGGPQAAIARDTFLEANGPFLVGACALLILGGIADFAVRWFRDPHPPEELNRG